MDGRGEALIRVNLGCGSLPEDGWVNLDSEPLPGVDVVHDLNEFPWPFEDGCAERVKAFDIFEHVCPGPMALDFMAECHRILAPGGQLWIHTVHFQSRNAWTDPTHIRASTEETFDYWCPPTYLNRRYGKAYARGRHFEKVRVYLDGGDVAAVLRKIT